MRSISCWQQTPGLGLWFRNDNREGLGISHDLEELQGARGTQGSRDESGTGRGSEVQSGQGRRGLVLVLRSGSLDLGSDVGSF